MTQIGVKTGDLNRNEAQSLPLPINFFFESLRKKAGIRRFHRSDRDDSE